MKSILFINRVYPPANGATGEMLREMAEGLAARGWDVTVLTSAEPGEPSRVIRGGVRLLRSGVRLSRQSVFLRAVSYLFMLPWLLARALLLPRTDFVVTLTDPPMLAVLGPMIGFFKRNKILHWAQDIYPEVAEELGVLPRGHALTRLLQQMSTVALLRCDAVVSIGRCMTKRLVARGVPYARIFCIPNWSPPVRTIDHPNNPFRQALGLEGDFVVVYSGNIGLAHEFDTLLDAAADLRGHHVVFLLIGDGPRRAAVQQAAEARNLSNIRFLPSQPAGKLSESLSAADAHLVTMRQNLCGLVVPSKVYGVLAVGRPCLFVGPRESEAARILLEHDAGSVIEPGQPAALAGAILDWVLDPAAHAAACRRARVAGASTGLREAIADFEEMLLSLSQTTP
jgi:glycosyltransferase involved in cell wall biosynthesis